MLKLAKTHEVAQSVIIHVKSYDKDYVERVLQDMGDAISLDEVGLRGARLVSTSSRDGGDRMRLTWSRGTGDTLSAAQYRKHMQPELQKRYPDAQITVRRDLKPRLHPA